MQNARRSSKKTEGVITIVVLIPKLTQMLDKNKFLVVQCSAAEFVVFKLKEMGKISEEDVPLVLEGFKALDVDRSGTLTENDLIVSSQ